MHGRGGAVRFQKRAPIDLERLVLSSCAPGLIL
jgi:hypothetical protein